MSGRALLSVEADIAAVQRAFGALRADSRDVSAAIAADFRRIDESGARAYRRIRREAGKAAEALIAAERAAADTAEASARRREQIATTEGNYRTNANRRTHDQMRRGEEEVTRDVERQSRRRLATAEREAREHARIARRYESRGRAAGSQAFNAAVSAGGAIAGDVRSERSRFATTERSMGLALYQAGAGRSEVAATTRRVQDYARAHPGMDSQALAAGINAAQTEMSVLANPALGRNRDERIGRLLEVGQLAHNTGNDTGEFMRVEGLLAQSGLDRGTRDTLLRYTAGAAQRGAVEAGTVTRQAMPSITARVNTAISDARRNGTDPQAAAQQAYAQSLAELEVARGMGGETPRAAGNALRDASNRLRSSTQQQNLLGNLRNSQLTEEQKTRLTAQLFEADPNRRGHQRLRSQYTNALNLAQAFGEAGVSRADFTNMVAGGGHGNPRSLLSNQSRVIGGLLDQSTNGRAGWQNVRDIMDVQGTSLTSADVARGAEVFGTDAAAREQQRTEERGAQLSDNTNAIVRLTERLDTIAAANPFLAPVASAGASFLGTQAATTGGGVIGRALAGGGALSAGGQGVMGSAARSVGGALGVGASGISRTVPVLAAVATLLHTTDLTAENAASRGGRGGSDAQQIAAWRASHGGGGGQATEALRTAVSQGVVEGLRQSGGVPVRTSPHDRVAAQNAASTTTTRPAP